MLKHNPNKPEREFNMNKRILMRIDMQNDFVHPHGSLTINDTLLIERHQKFADNIFKDNFDEIIDSYDTHFSETYDQTFEAQNFPKHCIFGTWGWQQAAPFKQELQINKIYKSTTNIWNELKTYQNLNQEWNKCDVYLCGVLSDICVVQALNGLLKKGANVIIIDDLCKGAKLQIEDILQNEVYQPFIQRGQLKNITTKQFFRSNLLNKKIQHNLVNRNLGE